MKMKEYLYLFRGGDAQRLEASSEEMQSHMGLWQGWMGELSETGNLLGGQSLENGGKVVRKTGAVITDGPYAEGNEVVGGYLIVKAKPIDEATDLSKGCPIFEHGGCVEIRELVGMDQ
jgi:hypothetical protein